MNNRLDIDSVPASERISGSTRSVASAAVAMLALVTLVLFLVAASGIEIMGASAVQESSQKSRQDEKQKSQQDEEHDVAAISKHLDKLAATELGPYAREDPLAEEFSIERAVSFMDGVAVNRILDADDHMNLDGSGDDVEERE